MKKLSLTICFLIIFSMIKAQSWNLNLNEGAATLKFGTSSADPINFYTNNHKVMSLATNGGLKLDSLAGTGFGVLYADENGILGRMPGYVPGRPCVVSALPWSQGGNRYVTDNTIGTCSGEDFILKSGDVKSVFVTTSGFVGVGINNASPQAALDISDQTYGSSASEHLKIYGDQNGTVESTTAMNLFFKTGAAYTIKEGAVGVGNPPTRFEIYNGVTKINTTKTNFGSQTNATNAAMLNVNMNSSNTGSSADNALDVYNQATQTINFRVKASGFVYAKEINVQLTAFPDYVFNAGYTLRSLENLETYIKEHQHLPNVPSAADIANDGANLGELSRIQLEKIEELTLYVIELKKEVEGLKKQVNK